jgi:mannosyltransferase
MNSESEDITVSVGKHSIPVLYILILAGAVFRIYHLGFNSLWLDEAATVAYSSGGLDQIWANMAAMGDFNPPLFNLLENIMMMIGTTEIALRLLPALFGIVAIPIMYLVGKEFKDKYIGIILAGLTAFSPFLITYSQEARAYSMMFFLGACMVLLFLRAMKVNKQTEWFLFAIVSAVAFWTHFYSIVLFIPLVILAVYKFRNDWQPIAFSVVAWFAMALPLIFALYTVILQRASSAPAYGYQGFNIIYQTFFIMFWDSYIAIGLAVVLFIVGIWWTFKNDKEMALFLIFVPAIVFITSVILSNTIPMLPRYLIFVNIFVFLGIAMACPALVAFFQIAASDNLQKNIKKETVIKVISFGLVGCFVISAVPFYTNYYQTYTKSDWRELGIELANITQPGDVVVVIPKYIMMPLDYYYSSKIDGTQEVWANNATQLEQIKNAADSQQLTVFYVITPDINSQDPSGNAIKWLAANTMELGNIPGIAVRVRIPGINNQTQGIGGGN